METAGSREFFVYSLPRAKGALILCILALHSTLEFEALRQPDRLGTLLAIVHALGRVGVPLFITISGFYLSLNPRNENALPFYRRTLRFLLVPWIAYSMFYALPPLLQRGDLIGYLRKLWQIGTTGLLSFLSIIVQLYLLHPFLHRWWRRLGRANGILAVALALQVSWTTATALLAGGEGVLPRCFPAFIGYFLGGYYLLEHSEEAARLMRRPGVAAAGGAAWVAIATVMAVLVDLPMLLDRPPFARAAGILAREVLLPAT